ncbi:cytochrome P450 [Hyaloraphidium curvatum]|nr:cytochrome P450 [Hyaloraphidium curvatum]
MLGLLLSPWLLVPLAALAVLLYLYPNTVLGSRVRRDVPVADGAWPLIGHQLALRRFVGRRLERAVEVAERFGEVVRSTFYSPINGVMEIYFLTNVQDVEFVYRDPWRFIKGPGVQATTREFLGHGIFASDGDQWKGQRKTASNIFNARNFREVFSPVFTRDADHIVTHLARAADLGLVVDMQEILLLSTADTFAQVALGKDIGALEVPHTVEEAVDARGNKYRRYHLPSVPFADALDEATHITASRGQNPFWQTTEARDGTRERYKAAVGGLDRFAREVIAKKRKEGNKSGKESDMVDLFMNLRDDNGNEFSDDFLRDVVVNMVLAGRDTTAQTLTWTFWELSRNPEVERKLREEILAVCGRDGEITYEHTRDMKYATAVFNGSSLSAAVGSRERADLARCRHAETLRLHANVPVQNRVVTEDCVLPGTGTRVYKGDFMQVSSFAMGYLERIWGPDAKVFRPERWFDDKGQLVKENQFKWPVFNAGPRICLGMNMATQEAVVFLAAVLRRFSLRVVHEDRPGKYSLPETKEGRYILGLTLGLREGLECEVVKV